MGETRARYAVPSQNYKRTLSSKVVNRDGTEFRTTYLNYDDFGNPGRVEEVSQGHSRATDYVYFNNTSNWVIGVLKDETINGIGSTTRTLDPATGDVLFKDVFNTVEGFKYYSSGDLSEYTDQNGVITEYEAYKRGKPERINKSVNKKGSHTVTQVINNDGNVDSVTIANKTTSYQYDSMGKVTKVTKPKATSDPASIAYETTLDGYAATVTRGSLKRQYYFDGFGRVVKTDTEGIIQNFTYDKSGRLSEKYLPDSPEKEVFEYDVLSRLKKIHPPTATTEFSEIKYLPGNKKELIDTNGHKTTFTYQSYGNPDEQHLINIDAPEGISIGIEKDVVGKTLSVAQGSLVREYHYDTRQLLDYTVNPETGTTDVDYDDAGNLTKKQHNSDPAIWYEYDGLNRLDLVNYPAGVDDIDYEYYEDGLTKTVSKGDTEWYYEYDDNNNLSLEQFDAEVSSPGSGLYVFYREYNSKDHLDKLTYPSGSFTNYNPNDLGQPKTVTPFVKNIEYFSNGQVNKVELANGAIAENQQDTSQKLSNMGVSTLYEQLVDRAYSHDFENNVSSILDNINSLNSRSFRYDGADRLTHVNNAQLFSYQPNGNITTNNSGGMSLVYNYGTTLNRLDSVQNGGETLYTMGHDQRGNVTSNGIDSFAYNYINQMIGVPSKGIQYKYDGNGNRYDTLSSSHTRSIYSNNGLLLYETNVADAVDTEYYYLGNQLIAKSEECQDRDADSDGMIDCVENRLGLSSSDPQDAALDLDGDGLSNLAELSLGTNPKQSDTDGDGIPDNYEVQYGLDPRQNDSGLDPDSDGLTNYQEFQYNTNPNLADTDNDGVSDGDEVANGTNPTFNVAVLVAINYLLLN